MVAGRCPDELAAKRADHERGVDAIAALGLDGVDGAALRNLGGLVAEVEEQGLQDGAGDVEAANVCAEADAEERAAQAEDDAEVRHEAVGHVARPDGADEHAGDADQAEEADGEAGVVVGSSGEEECEGGPEGGEGSGA